MPLEGQWERANTPLRKLTSRERLVAIVAIVIVTAGRSRPAPGPGCIRANVAMVMGAEELNLCGQHARRLCAQHADNTDPVALEIQASCREAGILRSP